MNEELQNKIADARQMLYNAFLVLEQSGDLKEADNQLTRARHIIYECENLIVGFQNAEKEPSVMKRIDALLEGV